MAKRWRWRGSVALLAVALSFFLYPLLPGDDVINSDWPAFATGARLILSDPGHLYDLQAQQRVQTEITGGQVLITPGIQGILPFLAPAWVAILAVPFARLGPDAGGRLWVLFGLACLIAGLYFATRPGPTARVLPAFASVPTALLMLNAQLDGLVVLGIGGALALWSRPLLAGLALGLTLMKPQLMLPVGFALILAREWKALAGWTISGLALLLPTLALNPNWIGQWLAQTRATVAPVSREVDVAHFGTLVQGSAQPYVVATLVVLALVAVLWLAYTRRDNLRSAAAILVAGGVAVSPHALPADLVVVALALAVWGEATWFEWLFLSTGALIAAVAPAPIPAVVGLGLLSAVLGRISLARRPAPALASPR